MHSKHVAYLVGLAVVVFVGYEIIKGTADFANTIKPRSEAETMQLLGD